MNRSGQLAVKRAILPVRVMRKEQRIKGPEKQRSGREEAQKEWMLSGQGTPAGRAGSSPQSRKERKGRQDTGKGFRAVGIGWVRWVGWVKYGTEGHRSRGTQAEERRTLNVQVYQTTGNLTTAGLWRLVRTTGKTLPALKGLR
jgi:hypothetical protein